MSIAQRYSFEYNTVFLVLLISVYVIIASVNLGSISQTLDVDSVFILDLARGGATGLEGKSYRNTGVFFSYIPRILLQPFVLLIGCFTLFVLLKNLRLPRTLLLAAFLSLPSMLFVLARPQKETIVILITLLVSFALNSKRSTLLKFLAIAIIYFLYAYFFRSYYVLIFIAFCCILVFKYSDLMLKIVLCLFGIAIFLVLPESLFMELQGSRDIFNFHRVDSGIPGNRTAFLNPMSPDSHIGFLVNYIYSAFYLNLAFFVNPGIREFFMLAIIYIYFYFIILGLKAKSQHVVFSAALLLAHIMIYLLFEPDLGSYLRHISSEILYLVPMLIMYEQHRMQRFEQSNVI